MHERGDLIGLLLLGLCVAVGGVLVYEIVTGTRFRYTGPDWLGWALAILFVGGGIYGAVISSGRRWPDPLSGRRRRWPWSRDRNGDSR